MSFKNLKLSVKIPLVMLALAAANALVVSSLALYQAKETAKTLSEQKLEAVTHGVSETVKNYFESIKEDLLQNAEGETTRIALRDFQSGWDALTGETQTHYLQTKYIDENPNETGKKHLLDAATDGSTYSTAHATYHPWFRSILTRHDYYDIFLIDTKGDVVYTVYKERDFATNLITGEWKDSTLGHLYRAIKDHPEKDKIYFEDFKPYSPSNNVPAAFIGTAIVDPKTQEFLGMIAYQMPIGRINEITQILNDVSASMNVHLVGEDHLLRNDPDTTDNNDPILKEKLDFDAVDKGLAGKSGVEWEIDDGQNTLASYAPIDAFGTKWTLFVNILETEAMESVYRVEKIIWLTTICVLIVVGLISVFYARTITNPIKSLMSAMGILANRNYMIEVPFRARGDELGDMARSVEVFKQNGLAVQKLESEQAALKAKAEEDKKAAMNALADNFDSRTAGIIKSLAAAATEMQATAAQMTAASSNTAHASQIVASAAAEADSNVQTVAAATEELSSSSMEISRQISSVAEKSSRASGAAVETSQQVGELNSLADSIGEVIGAIKDIAEQTNLLALNATIEAARAGEAGKGFAVVADEVKKLATETASKTIQIDERVGRIQAAIRGTVDAVGRIIEDVQDIDHSTSTVASAVEEQNAATAEIGRNVSEASSGTQQVAHNISDVQRSAEETGEAADNLNAAATELAEIAENLQNQVAIFLKEIRES